jgi:hypothetical protein
MTRHPATRSDTGHSGHSELAARLRLAVLLTHPHTLIGPARAKHPHRRAA